ncbi:MAG: osmotically inducible protein OsmC [Euryarchaeota archaeon]|nr:osmotically inducible protein OsmC [Euryarchaeota archaeon]|tara:strand:+ start:19861 stop:20262 length:402 start_codon:yes stop_codon:yes gene_type:complete
MVKIEVKYEGGFRCIATHIPSGRELVTDAPLDNHGKGESFSPTDLLATSMLTCIMTIIGIRAEKKKIDVSGMLGSVEKTMYQNPRRVGMLEIKIKLPKYIEEEDRKWLIQEGCECPVCHSVNKTMEVKINFQN